MRRFLFWLTMASAAGAAYLMNKRGAPLGEIALNSVVNPVGTLARELKAVL